MFYIVGVSLQENEAKLKVITYWKLVIDNGSFGMKKVDLQAAQLQQVEAFRLFCSTSRLFEHIQGLVQVQEVHDEHESLSQ
jgi:hypothetical protein